MPSEDCIVPMHREPTIPRYIVVFESTRVLNIMFLPKPYVKHDVLMNSCKTSCFSLWNIPKTRLFSFFFTTTKHDVLNMMFFVYKWPAIHDVYDVTLFIMKYIVYYIWFQIVQMQNIMFFVMYFITFYYFLIFITIMKNMMSFTNSKQPPL